MNIVTRKLIAKEFYVNRWFVAGATIAAVLSLGITALGKMAFNIGTLALLTTVVAFGVLIGIYGVTNERKEHSLEFVLSLPLSSRDYVISKLLGLLISFLVPWTASLLGAIALVLLTEVPDGMLPYTVALFLYLLTNFSALLCGALHARSEALSSAVIIVTNMSISVYMFTVGALPGMKDTMFGPTPVWNSTFYWLVTGELVALVLCLSLPLVLAARRRDFI